MEAMQEKPKESKKDADEKVRRLEAQVKELEQENQVLGLLVDQTKAKVAHLLDEMQTKIDNLVLVRQLRKTQNGKSDK